MGSNAWSVPKVAALGAVAGLAYSVAKAAINHPGAPLEYYGGAAIGGIVGGAVLFGLVALVRNWFGRPKPKA